MYAYTYSKYGGPDVLNYVALPTPTPKANEGWCQTNSNSSLLGQHHCPLCRAKTAPLRESDGTGGFEMAPP